MPVSITPTRTPSPKCPNDFHASEVRVRRTACALASFFGTIRWTARTSGMPDKADRWDFSVERTTPVTALDVRATSRPPDREMTREACAEVRSRAERACETDAVSTAATEVSSTKTVTRSAGPDGVSSAPARSDAAINFMINSRYSSDDFTLRSRRTCPLGAIHPMYFVRCDQRRNGRAVLAPGAGRR